MFGSGQKERFVFLFAAGSEAEASSISDIGEEY